MNYQQVVKTAAAALKFFAVIVMIPALAIWRAYVFMLLWMWFAIPWFGFPTLGTAQSVGLLALIALAVPYRHPRKDEIESLSKTIVTGMAWPAYVLLVGWIVKAFL